MPQVANLKEVSAKTVGWAGGVNIRDAVNQLSPDELRKAENVVLDEKGGLSKRKGCQSNGTIGIGGERILQLYTFYRGTTAPQVLAYTNQGKLYYTTDPNANPVVWTQIATGLSTTVPFSFETFNSKAYMGNGVDSYASWDGATYVTFPTTPKGKYLRLWKDTMFISGITGLPDRVYESAAGDAENWPVASWIDIAKGDGDLVVALASDGFFLIVGKRDRAFVIYDPVSLANRIVDFEKGFESHFAVKQFEGILYYLSRRGICLWYGDAPSKIISEKLDPLFDPTIIAIEALQQAQAYSIDNRIGFALPEVGNATNTIVIEYYPRLAGVTPFGNRGYGPFVFHRMPAQCFTRVRTGATDRLFAGHNAANKFLRVFADVGTDDGVAFTGTGETGAIDLSQPGLTKYIRRLRLLCRGKFNVFILRNFQASIYRTMLADASAAQDLWDSVGDVWGTGTWGPDSIIKELELSNPDAYGRYFTFRFQDAAEVGTGLQLLAVGASDRTLVAGEWGIYGMLVEGSLLGVRK